MKNILIIDDEEHIRDLLSEILRINNFESAQAANALEARKLMEYQSFELILCDINMPGESGLDFVQHVAKNFPDTASIMITALDDPLVADKALQLGVYDYVTKPFELNGVLISVANALRRRELEIENRAYQKKLEIKVKERSAALRESEARLRAIFEAAKHIAFILVDNTKNPNLIEFSPGAEFLFGYNREEIIGKPAMILNLPEEIFQLAEIQGVTSAKEVGFTRELTLTRRSGENLPTLSTTYPILNSVGAVTAVLVVVIDISERIKASREIEASMEKWRKAVEGIIQSMALTLEMRDPYTAGHQQRVSRLVVAIAEAMGFPNERIEGLKMAAMIHDIGKISVPAEILSKPGVITEIEFNMIKTHPNTGKEILEGIEFPWPIAKMVFQHHERIDGSGYPSGLKGQEILLEAKILGVADVVEAMASHRPYRPSLGIEKAIEEITRNKGKLYDTEVVDACLKIFETENFKFD
jgi:PAS domain S-box-containing protein/putative nucleotidyltransferase with HDIG domain